MHRYPLILPLTVPLSVLLTVMLTGCQGLSNLTLEPAAPPSNLGDLTVRAESHEDSYQRDDFGQRWKDVDRNGCGQRDDALARDLTDVQRRGRCVVVSGELTDPYTGERVTFRKADASDVQIDHVVALAEAWRSGAWSWGDDRLERYANTLANIVAASGPVNASKSDKDAAGWMPDGAVRRCTYARDVVSIKGEWNLSVDDAEARALSRAIKACPKPPPRPSP